MSDPKGLSILIPIYNYNAFELVKSLSDQARSLPCPCEILCYDDGSTLPETHRENQRISSMPNVTFKALENNIGRSRIRNLLARESKFPFLLFIDCDSKLVRKDYLQRYMELAAKHPVVPGGTVYSDENYPDASLRLKYGRMREQQAASARLKFPYHYINLNNILIHKEIYLQNPLDEDISTYGHEDTKFGYYLKEKHIPVYHTDNPVEHCGLETNAVFLSKTREGIVNFYKIAKQGYGRDTKLYKAYRFLKKTGLSGLFCNSYRLFTSRIENNLNSQDPSLLYFDLYKLKNLLDQETD